MHSLVDSFFLGVSEPLKQLNINNAQVRGNQIARGCLGMKAREVTPMPTADLQMYLCDLAIGKQHLIMEYATPYEPELHSFRGLSPN